MIHCKHFSEYSHWTGLHRLDVAVRHKKNSQLAACYVIIGVIYIGT